MCRPAGASGRGWLCIGFDASQFWLSQGWGSKTRADEVTWSEGGASPFPQEPYFSGSASAHCSPTHRVETTSSSWRKQHAASTTSPETAADLSSLHQEHHTALQGTATSTEADRDRKRLNMAADTAFLLNIKERPKSKQTRTRECTQK